MRDNIGRFNNIKYDKEGNPVDKVFSSKKKERDYIIEYRYTSEKAHIANKQKSFWDQLVEGDRHSEDRKYDEWRKYNYKGFSKLMGAKSAFKQQLREKSRYMLGYGILKITEKERIEKENKYKKYLDEREFRIRCLRTNEIVEIDKDNI